jgi:cytochrome c peroxidase
LDSTSKCLLTSKVGSAFSASSALNFFVLKSVRFFLMIFFLSFSCGKRSSITPDQPYQLNLPPGWEQPKTLPDNPLTEKRVELGKYLFFDPIVSDDSTISCSSCHIPELAFTDGRKLPIGIQGKMGTRNSPTLVNVAYYPYFFAEGKVTDLETQALAPGLHSEEMGTEMKAMIYRLRGNKFYRKKFKETFNTDTIELKHFVYAIANYERTLIAYYNPYEKHKTTGGSYSVEEKEGEKLFFSNRTNCSKCHNGNLFTDFSFQNIGLSKWYEDPGVARATSLPKDSGMFKTPTLLNIEYTDPYMHDGSISTLEEVVEFYNSGGKDHPNKSKFIQPLRLSDHEKKCLVDFLKTLTDFDLKMRKGIFKTPELKYE